MRRYRKLMWGKNAKDTGLDEPEDTGLDEPEDRKAFNDWSQKLMEKTYDFT